MSQSFFQQLIGQRVYFINPLGRENSCIVTQKGAIELYKLQKHGYRFIPQAKTANVCISCEG